MASYEAVFTKVAHAVRYAEAMKDDSVINLHQTGRKVTFEDAQSALGNPYLFQDRLERVGFYGSAPQGRKATLNGIKAPASW